MDTTVLAHAGHAAATLAMVAAIPALVLVMVLVVVRDVRTGRAERQAAARDEELRRQLLQSLAHASSRGGTGLV